MEKIDFKTELLNILNSNSEKVTIGQHHDMECQAVTSDSYNEVIGKISVLLKAIDDQETIDWLYSKSDFKDIYHLLSNVACRIENEPETNEVSLTIVDRSMYPRLWIDNGLDGTRTLAQTSESILLKSNPFLEKDWLVRFLGSDLTDCINQYNNYINR